MSTLKLINKDTKNTKLDPYQENIYKKIGRKLLFSLNFAFSIAGSYFGATLFLTIVSASLLGTPVGWGIIGALILVTITSKLLIRRNYIYTLLNPVANHHESVRDKFNDFKDKTDDIDHTLTILNKLDKSEKIDQSEKLKTKQELLTQKTLKLDATSSECPTFFKPGKSLQNQIIADSHLSDKRRMSCNF